jgi:hypothetical protein
VHAGTEAHLGPKAQPALRGLDPMQKSGIIDRLCPVRQTPAAQELDS